MERARRTHDEEFCNFYNGGLTMGHAPSPTPPHGAAP